MPRPTRAGATAGVFTLALIVVGLAGANNLVVAVGAACLAAWGVELLLGGLHLRGLEVQRVLPDELFAGQEGRGALRIVNRRRWLATRAVAVREQGREGIGGAVARIVPGEAVLVPVGWRFAGRGVAELRGVVLASAWPFGWLRRVRRVTLPAEIVVYPRPRRAAGVPRPARQGVERAGGRAGREGDFAGLRAWRPGDRARAIHWPTTARRGEPVVVERTGAAGSSVRVQVPACADRAWEHALSTACGQVLRAFEQGYAVGLEVPGDRPRPARAGSRWRRALLEALARAPDGGPR